MPIPSGASILLDAEKILSHLRVTEGMCVGELGCGGRGHFVFPVVRLVGSKGKVYAIDVVKTVLTAIEHEAREQHWFNIVTVWSDLESVGAALVPEHTLDRATLINVLFQVQNHEAVLRETQRLLKPQSSLLVVDWKPESAPFGPNPTTRVPKERIVHLAQGLGFTSTEDFAAGPYHYGLIFTLPS